MHHLDSTATASFAEFAGIEHILLGDLRQLLSEPLTEQSRVWIQKRRKKSEATRDATAIPPIRNSFTSPPP